MSNLPTIETLIEARNIYEEAKANYALIKASMEDALLEGGFEFLSSEESVDVQYLKCGDPIRIHEDECRSSHVDGHFVAYNQLNGDVFFLESGNFAVDYVNEQFVEARKG